MGQETDIDYGRIWHYVWIALVIIALLGLMSKFLDMLPFCQTTSGSYPNFLTAAHRAYT